MSQSAVERCDFLKTSWHRVFEFSSLLLLLRVIICALSSRDLPRVLGILFTCHLSIRSFFYIISITIFYPGIVLHYLHPIVGIPTCIFLLAFGRIFFLVYFEKYIFIVLFDFVSVFLKSPFFTSIFWFISSNFIVRFVCCFILLFSSQPIPEFPPFPLYLYWSFSLSSHPGFFFSVRVF